MSSERRRLDGSVRPGGFTLWWKIRCRRPSGLQRATDELLAATGESPQIHDAFTGYRADTPWLSLEIDRTAAYLKGVSQSEIPTRSRRSSAPNT